MTNQTIYLVGVPHKEFSLFVVPIGLCSSMDEVVKRYGTTWKERVNVYEMEVDSGNVGTMIV